MSRGQAAARLIAAHGALSRGLTLRLMGLLRTTTRILGGSWCVLASAAASGRPGPASWMGDRWKGAPMPCRCTQGAQVNRL